MMSTHTINQGKPENGIKDLFGHKETKRQTDVLLGHCNFSLSGNNTTGIVTEVDFIFTQNSSAKRIFRLFKHFDQAVKKHKEEENIDTKRQLIERTSEIWEQIDDLLRDPNMDFNL